MIVVSRGYVLPVGEIYRPPARHAVIRPNDGPRRRTKTINTHVRQIALRLPGGQLYRGPFFVRREVTLEEYCAWFAQEYGEPVHETEKRSGLRPDTHQFFEILID